MVERLRDHYQIRDARVLEAMRSVPRHHFVPEALQGRAYGDHALPISGSQTISQPYIVARMTELLEISPDSRVLEIGAGSGYQTAILAKVAGQVYSIERIASLAREAQSRIRRIEYLQRDGEVFRRDVGLGGECALRRDIGGGGWTNDSGAAGGAIEKGRPAGRAGRRVARVTKARANHQG